VYSILLIVSIYKARLSFIFLKNKLIYALPLAPEYVPALFLKIKMLVYLVVTSIIYWVSYITMISILKVTFYKYTSSTFMLVLTHCLDYIFMGIFLYIFRSRIFPEYFSLSYLGIYDRSHLKGEVYKCYLPSIRKTFYDGFDLSFTEKKNIIKSKLPVVIINPIFYDELPWLNDETIFNSICINDSETNSDFNITNKISIAFPSKPF
jgi:hypothetical protein